MNATDGAAPSTSRTPAPHRGSLRARWQPRLRRVFEPAWGFWTKLQNDWVFNLSAMVAYSLLLSIFPILLVFLAVLGFALGDLAPQTLAAIQSAIEHAVPGGGDIFAAVAARLAQSAGALLVIGVVTSVIGGSRLFIVLEHAFGIIFRVPARDTIRQNVMAVGMLALYLVLVPIIALASVIPATIMRFAGPAVEAAVQGALADVLGLGVAALAAALFFGAVYAIVPNRRMRLAEVWPGTVVATALLVLYELVFPIYTSWFLHPENYGSVAGFAVVILVFFYYLALILLVGAELNAWVGGLRALPGGLQTLIHDAQTAQTAATAAEARRATEGPFCTTDRR
jgi:membrane protein